MPPTLLKAQQKPDAAFSRRTFNNDTERALLFEFHQRYASLPPTASAKRKMSAAKKTKLQHWRGVWSIIGPKAARMLEFQYSFTASHG